MGQRNGETKLISHYRRPHAKKSEKIQSGNRTLNETWEILWTSDQKEKKRQTDRQTKDMEERNGVEQCEKLQGRGKEEKGGPKEYEGERVATGKGVDINDCGDRVSLSDSYQV